MDFGSRALEKFMQIVNNRLGMLAPLMSLITLVVPGCEQVKKETIDRGTPSMQVKRLLDQPIITPELDESIGVNNQGPSVIRVPDWVENSLGNYYRTYPETVQAEVSGVLGTPADFTVGPFALFRGSTRACSPVRLRRKTLSNLSSTSLKTWA